jgi:hypothetical protein
MPDHVHLILTPLTNETLRGVVSLVEIMQAIKSASSHAIHRRVGDRGPIWQEESFDRIVRSSESVDAKIAYILQNPVRKGLVKDWRQYRLAVQFAGEKSLCPSVGIRVPQSPLESLDARNGAPDALVRGAAPQICYSQRSCHCPGGRGRPPLHNLSNIDMKYFVI